MEEIGKTDLYLPILLILTLMVVIPISSTSHSDSATLRSPEGYTLRFFHCNGSSSTECFGGSGGHEEPDDNLGMEFLMESGTSKMVDETRRMLQQRGRRTSTNTLNAANAVCGRDKYGYLCTPKPNQNVKRSENCRRNTFNRNCHQQPRLR